MSAAPAVSRLLPDDWRVHLPVFDGEEVIGIVTTGDLLAHELAEKSAKIQHLEDFVFYTRS